MIAVIFEVIPHERHRQDYFDTAAHLREQLEQIDGFIGVERFQSLTNPNKVLSLSFFESEEAVTQWRNTDEHRDAQNAGRYQYFEDYRLRIAEIVRDYGPQQRLSSPQDSN